MNLFSRDIEVHNTKESASFDTSASGRTAKMLALEEARSEAADKRSAAARQARDAAVEATEGFVQREVEQRQELEGKIREVRIVSGLSREVCGHFAIVLNCSYLVTSML